MKQPKNYINLVNDHSGSMSVIRHAALKDYNSNINAIKEAATREMLDTVVSVIGIGLGNGVERQVVISNPHVLKAAENWPCPGGTPLYDGIGNAIKLMDGLPDIKDEHVSVLVMITTDGQEMHSKEFNSVTLARWIKERQDTGRWTFVLRVPTEYVSSHSITCLGIPLDNIQGWDTTSEGMAASTATSTAAMDGFFAARSAGRKASSSFYANAASVDVNALSIVPESKIKTYVVDQAHHGKWIRDFILTKRMKFLKGACFFQLTKTEGRVGPEKLILLRDKDTGIYYGGEKTREMLGLPKNQNVRLHPGMQGVYDIFVQSTSINRHLIAGTGVMYWEEMGVETTQEDEDRVAPPKPKAAAVIPKVLKLAEVAPTKKPTKSPLVPTKRRQFAVSRDDARILAKQQNKKWRDNGSGSAKGERWEVI